MKNLIGEKVFELEQWDSSEKLRNIKITEEVRGIIGQVNFAPLDLKIEKKYVVPSDRAQ